MCNSAAFSTLQHSAFSDPVHSLSDRQRIPFSGTMMNCDYADPGQEIQVPNPTDLSTIDGQPCAEFCQRCRKLGPLILYFAASSPRYEYDQKRSYVFWSSSSDNNQHNCRFCNDLEIIFKRFRIFLPRTIAYHIRVEMHTRPTWRYFDLILQRAHEIILTEYTEKAGYTSRTPSYQFSLLNKEDPTTQCDLLPSSAPQTTFDPRQVDYESINGWLEFCRDHHPRTCGRKAEQPAITLKLINCKTRRVELSSCQKYVALSYLWGKNHISHPQRLGPLPEPVPLTVEDAISVAINLDVPYLWVDRYCIDQDNDTERTQTINTMDKVYAGAEVTIIAAAGDGPEYGLPGVSKTSRNPLHVMELSGRSFVAMPSQKHLILNSKWYSRGWTYQEMLLSRRRLVFTDDQVYFQCRLVAFLEKNSSAWLSQDRYPACAQLAFPENGFGLVGLHIYERLEEYVSKDLSLASDTVNAFEGIFSAYLHPEFCVEYEHEKYSVSHFYGIPIWTSEVRGSRFERGSFARGLAWTKREGNRLTIRDANNHWPTWSWARFQGNNLCFKEGFGIDFLINRSTIHMHLTAKSGDRVDISQYDVQQKDYTRYQPWIDITSWTISGFTKVNASPASKVLVFGSNEPNLDYEDTPHDVVVGIFLGTIYRRITFLLVAGNGSGCYVRIGLLDLHLDVIPFFDEMSNPAACRPWNISPDAKLDAKEGSWKYQTLRLV